MWTEVWYGGSWHHCDACETCLDAPLTYEVGWGKKLTYIIAFGPTEVVDVTARYTRNWAAVLSRRTLLSEEQLAKAIEDSESSLRGDLLAPAWRDLEEAELAELRSQKQNSSNLSPAELCGRTSGSTDWRAERGELGILPVLIAESSTTIDPSLPSLEPKDANVQLQPAQLLSGAALGQHSTGVRCLELRAPFATVELPAEAPDAFLCPEGFTVEAWVAASAEELQPLAHANPVISRHGPASGWELRICAEGAVVFLVTVDGIHKELQSASCCEWRGQWIHVAGSFDGQVSRIFVGKELVAEQQVAAGRRCTPIA